MLSNRQIISILYYRAIISIHCFKHNQRQTCKKRELHCFVFIFKPLSTMTPILLVLRIEYRLSGFEMVWEMFHINTPIIIFSFKVWFSGDRPSQESFIVTRAVIVWQLWKVSQSFISMLYFIWSIMINDFIILTLRIE